MLANPILNAPFTEDERFEIEAQSYFCALAALEEAERAVRRSGVTRAQIADKSGLDRSVVSKILSGKRRNITLNTLFLLLRSMGRKPSITSKCLSDLSNSRNYRIDDQWNIAPSNDKRLNNQVLTTAPRRGTGYGLNITVNTEVRL